MKKLLMIAVLAGALLFVGSAATAEASCHRWGGYYGGGGFYTAGYGGYGGYYGGPVYGGPVYGGAYYGTPVYGSYYGGAYPAYGGYYGGYPTTWGGYYGGGYGYGYRPGLSVGFGYRW